MIYLFLFCLSIMNMVFITTKTWQDSDVEVIPVGKIKWLNKKNTEKKLGHSNLTMVTAKYSGDDRRKKRQELQDCGKSRPTRIFIREDLGIQVIMDCKTVQAVKISKELGFNQHDPIMTQEQSVLTKLDTYSKTEEKIFQHYVLGYRIDMYIPEYKLAIEVDELGHCTGDLKSEIERQKRTEEELGCKFIRMYPSSENFDIIDEFSRIKDYLLKSTNKATKKKTEKKKFQIGH